MDKKRVLFVCTHNSARSQMAEVFLKYLAPDRFEVESAGLEAGTLNPLVVQVMQEVGLDISGNRTKTVKTVSASDRPFDYVITMCEAAACPVLPARQVIHWPFDDPAQFQGTPDEKLARIRIIRDKIRQTIEQWLKQSED